MPDADHSTLVIVPTYNERDNLVGIVEALGKLSVDLLVVDDNSPDGTGDLADELSGKHDFVNVLHRQEKNGLGRAYCAGFEWALERDYKFVFEMDGDFSHDPNDIPHFLKMAAEADLVLGTRYRGGIRVMNWALTVRDTGLSSYDLKEGKPPRREITNQRAFGSVVYKVRVDRAEQRPRLRANADGTLENRSDVYLLLGQSGNSPEFELLDPQTNRITKSQHVKVVESDLSGPGMTPEHGSLEILAAARGADRFAHLRHAAQAAAVDADDGGGSSHGFDRSRGLPRPKSRPRCAAAHHTEPMRVVAGTVRGRRLAGPTGDGLRPTGDRVRESIFNSLFSRGAVDGAVVLDLFAGTGALGIEALSRGAQRAVFVESSPVSAQLVRDNLATCGMTDRAEVVVADGPTWLGSDRTPWDLVLLDPPYGFADWSDLLGGGLSRRLSDRLAGMVVLESDREIDPGPGWHVESVRSHGTTVVMLMTPPLLAAQYAGLDASLANVVAILCLILGCVVAGWCADRFGSGATMIGWSVLLGASYWLMMSVVGQRPDQLMPLYALAGFAVGITGAIPAVAVKAFPAAVRFSGLSFSYNVAYAIFGGFTPIIVTTLMRWYPMSPAIYVVALSAMGVVIGLFLLRSPAGRRLAVMPS